MKKYTLTYKGYTQKIYSQHDHKWGWRSQFSDITFA